MLEKKIPTMDGSTGSQQALISKCYSRCLSQKKEGLFTTQRKHVSFVEIEWEDSHFSSVMSPTVTVRYMKQAGRRKGEKRENTEKEKEGRVRTFRSSLDPQSACVSSQHSSTLGSKPTFLQSDQSVMQPASLSSIKAML